MAARKTAQEKVEEIAEIVAEAGAQPAPEPVHVEVMGVSCDMDPGALDNLELLDLMAQVDEGNILKLPAVMRLMFGEDWAHIHEQLRDGRGVVTATRAVKFFAAAMEAAGAKNS